MLKAELTLKLSSASSFYSASGIKPPTLAVLVEMRTGQPLPSSPESKSLWATLKRSNVFLGIRSY